MVTNFENITFELTEEELRLVPDICEAFRKYTKENPIKSDDIVRKVNDNREKLNISLKFTDSRLRKICNYIRSNGMIPLIATSSGYYTDYSKEALESQIKSLKERASSIYRCAVGLEKFLPKEGGVVLHTNNMKDLFNQ